MTKKRQIKRVKIDREQLKDKPRKQPGQITTADIIKSVQKRLEQHPATLGTRLRVGDIVDLGSEGHHLVWMVNDCRAACVPLRTTTVQFDTAQGTVQYEARQKTISISPDSESPIVKRLGKQGMINFLEQQKEERTMSKDKTETKKNKKSEGPKLGKLGGYLGYPITAVIRAMGKAGWKFWEARLVFDNEGIKVADNTIRIQLNAGASGKQDPAPIDKAKLKNLRPDPDEKPSRKANAKKSSKKGSKNTEKTTKTSSKKSSKKNTRHDDDEDEDERPARKSDEDEGDFEDGE